MKKDMKMVSIPYMMVGTAFCVCLVAANLFEVKVFRVCDHLTLTGGFLLFPVTYILNDCVSEVWGYQKARFLIWMSFVLNIFVVAVGGLVCLLPPLVPGGDAAFRAVFSFAPQIVAASLLAFLAGSFLNARVMSGMKRSAPRDGHYRCYFSLRAILSTVVGESADSLVFFPLAFGLFPWLVSGSPVLDGVTLVSVMLTQVVLKTLFEVLALPFTLRFVAFLKRLERDV